MTITETWLPIEGTEGWYDVSDLGRIRTWHHPGSIDIRATRPKILIPHTGRAGYPGVTLAVNGEHRSVHVHREVTRAFLGPCPEGMEVCHNNGDPADSLLTNLRYDTRARNIQDAVKHGTLYRGGRKTRPKPEEPRKPSLNRALLTEADVRAIRQLCAERRMSQSEIGAQYGVTQVTVSAIHTRRRWALLTDDLVMAADGHYDDQED